MKYSLRHQAVLGLVVALFVALVQGQATERIWTNRAGRSVVAGFVSVRAGKVRLRARGGPITVPLAELSEADQQYVRSIRTWRYNSDKLSVKARLLKVRDGKATLEQIDGKKIDIEISKLSKADRRYLASRPRDLSAVFAELDRKESSKIPAQIADLIAIYKDVEKKHARVTRLKALRDLGGYGHKAASALPFLRTLLLEDDVEVRRTVFAVLTDIGKPSVPTLIAILEAMKDPGNFAADPFHKNNTSSLAYLAMASLAKIGDDAKGATGILLELSVRSDNAFASYVGFRNGGGRIRYQPTEASSLSHVAFDALGEVNSDSDTITPGLIKILKTSLHRYERFRESKGSASHDIRVDLVRESSRVLQRLKDIGSTPKELVPLAKGLFEMAKEDELWTGPEVCELTIGLLGRIGPGASGALPLLTSKLDDERLGKLAEEAIAAISEPDSSRVDPVKSTPASMRIWRYSSNKRPVRARLLKVSEGKVTLEQIDGTSIDVEISKLSKVDRKYIASRPRDLRVVFAGLDAKESSEIPRHVADLIAIYKDKNNKAHATRVKALRDLGGYGHKGASALPFLRTLLLEDDVEVRRTVFAVLTDIGKPSVPTLVGILEAMKTPRNFASDPLHNNRLFCLANMAMESLGEIGEDAKDATSILIELSVRSDRAFANDVKNHTTGGFRRQFQGIDASSFSYAAFDTLGKVNSDSGAITPGLVRILGTYIRRYDSFRKKTGYADREIRDDLAERALRVLQRLEDIGSAPKECVPLAKDLFEIAKGHNPMPRLMPAFGPTFGGKPGTRDVGWARPEICQQTIHLLGRIGPDASDAVPLLKSMLEDATFGEMAEEAIVAITEPDSGAGDRK